MIEARVRKKLGAFELSSDLGDSGVICLTGRNGAGKTSLLSVISGLLKPDEGYVRLNSKDITNLPIEQRNIVLVTPDSYLPHLDVESHLQWGQKAAKKTEDREADGALGQEVTKSLGIFSIEDKRKKVGQLSLGMRGRVALATAILARPSAILVDEIFSNIDDRQEFVKRFIMLAKKAIPTIDMIFTTQNSEDFEFAEHRYRIVEGKTERIS